jgi:hypothetical protein
MRIRIRSIGHVLAVRVSPKRSGLWVMGDGLLWAIYLRYLRAQSLGVRKMAASTQAGFLSCKAADGNTAR